MKKIVISLGAVMATIAPLGVVIACNSSTKAEQINGKTYAEIKALNSQDFTKFINDVLHQAQPETLTGKYQDGKVDLKQKNVKFSITSDKKIEYTDVNNNVVTLNNDVSSPNFLADLKVYANTKSKEVKAWWKNVVLALKVYFAQTN